MKLLFTLALACFIAPLLKSQIVITSTNLPSSGDNFLYSNAKLSSVGDYTTTGTNHTWHFDTLRPTSQGNREYKNGLNTPYYVMFGLGAFGEKTADTLPIPNIPIPGAPAISVTDIYSFYKKTTSMYTAEGLGLKINGFPSPNFYTDEDELYMLPLTHGNPKDSTTFRFSTTTNTLVPFRYVKQGYRITEVDGWGTITTPYGTDNCLRIVTTQYSIDTLRGSITLPVVGTVPFNIGRPNYVRSYQWLTLGEKIPYLEVSGNLTGSNFVPSRAKYRDIQRQFVGIKEESNEIALSVFPNPSNNEVTIVVPQKTEGLTIEITDLQGKLLKTQHFTENTSIPNQYSVDVSDLATGLYILNLTTTQNKQSLKISIQ